MNFDFESYLNQENKAKLPYFQGYRITDFTLYSLALCLLSGETQDPKHILAVDEMLETIKHIHLYHQDWLKGNKASISKLFELVSEQVLMKFPDNIPSFALFNTKENGTIYVLKKTSSFRLWLLRKNKLYCLDRTSRWMRFYLGFHYVSLEHNAPYMLSYSWRTKPDDFLFLQEESRSLPSKKKSWRKLYRLLATHDKKKLLPLGIIAHLSSI
jgi:hypothetical protein